MFTVQCSIVICHFWNQMRRIFILATTVFFLTTHLNSQGRGGRGAQQPPPTAKAGAPIDLTGYWVSLVTQDWRVRMFAPPKGDYAGIPLNAAARKIADAWDPAKDEAAGEQCRSYGAAGLMRVPRSEERRVGKE